jgi:hypothetical protein
MEVVMDKGYHSGKTVMALDSVEVRSYIPDPGLQKADCSVVYR